MSAPRQKTWQLQITCEPFSDRLVTHRLTELHRGLTVRQFVQNRIDGEAGRRLLKVYDAYDGDDLETPLNAEDPLPAEKLVLATKGAGPPVVVQHALRTRKGLVFLPTERSARGAVELDARPLVDVAVQILYLDRPGKLAPDAVLDFRRRLLACASAFAATDPSKLCVMEIERCDKLIGATAQVDLTANLWAAIRPTFGKRLVHVIQTTLAAPRLAPERETGKSPIPF